MFIINSAPIILLLTIIVQTLIICLIIWLSINTRWFAIILFLIFLGGLMVLFIYIVRLASNEIAFIDKTSLVILTSIIIICATGWVIFNEQNLTISNLVIKKFIKIIISTRFFTLIIITIIYLLITLIVVIKISNKYAAPIKNLTLYDKHTKIPPTN